MSEQQDQIDALAKEMGDLKNYISFLYTKIPVSVVSFEEWMAGSKGTFDLATWEAHVRAEITEQVKRKLAVK